MAWRLEGVREAETLQQQIEPGIAFQAVETFAGVTLGLAGAAVLAAPGTRVRRWSLVAAATAALLGATARGGATLAFI